MAKITRAGGPSLTAEEAQQDEPVRVHRQQIGKVDQPRPGISSTQSSSNESRKSDVESQSHPSPAPTTENPSSMTEKEDSSVVSTDGDGLKTEQPPSASRRPAKRAPAKKATTRTLDFEEF